MCTSKSCSIQREEGFASAFVIAHETGHVLGMTHDGDQQQSNECIDDPNTGSVMAPLVRSSFTQYRWSHCSNRELKEKLVNYNCLNKPRQRLRQKSGKDIKLLIYQNLLIKKLLTSTRLIVRLIIRFGHDTILTRVGTPGLKAESRHFQPGNKILKIYIYSTII